MTKKDMLLLFRLLRKQTGTTQEEVAQAMNRLHRTTYDKSAISNYEKGKTTATIDRLKDLLECLGAKVHILVEQPINKKFHLFFKKMPTEDRMKFWHYILKIHSETKIEELQYKLYVNNYINKYVDIIAKKNNCVSFLFLEKDVNQRFDYQYKVVKES